MSPEAAPALTAQARLEHALELAFRHLGRRDRTVQEMRHHLEAKDVQPTVVQAAIAELAEQGYLDDARYAQRFAEDRRTLDGWGAQRIERRLATVGVGAEHIAAALGVRDAGDELEAAVEQLVRRFRVPPATDRDRDRALGFLVRKGHPLELAYDAVRAFGRA